MGEYEAAWLHRSYLIWKQYNNNQNSKFVTCNYQSQYSNNGLCHSKQKVMVMIKEVGGNSGALCASPHR